MEFSFWYIFLTVLGLLILLAYFESNDPIRFHGKYFIFYAYACATSLFLIPYFLLSPWNPRNSTHGSVIYRQVTKLLGIKWEIRGGELLKNEGNIIVANHQNSLDILGLFNIWWALGKCTVVSKKELFYVWPFGLAAWLGGVVFLNRSNRKQSSQHLNQTGNLLIKKATKLIIFPEGTRNKNSLSGGLLPFKFGAFKLAIENQVPILPIVYSPYYFVNEKNHFFGRGKVIVQILKPISTKDLTVEDIPKLAEKTQEIMQKEFEALSREMLSTLPNNYLGLAGRLR
ncbi:1-acyl-sn-glycerol-3-phosphate acyltransferase beta [Orussus abietinus]|uniref:1-acyl-sn-glycerol-3-phosphate acyltransferase beta n=1 Tax=Orussus abietinus TaxID=222816 RepID=UPI000625970A|nr:1-acyl-sn-glycerol-3-phosphate acyltransferase beta [Orussus abietinus]